MTCIEPNKILVRGYPLDEIMGRLTFGETIYLLLVGELPTPGMGRLMEAMLVSFIDHGATPPSTLAARNTATTGAPLRACVAAGVLGFGRYHGGDIESCMQFLDTGLALCATASASAKPPSASSSRCLDAGEAPPGFGHRFHTRDPRAARLFQMALELEVESDHIQMIRAVELVLHGASRRSAAHGPGEHRWRDRRRLRGPRDSADASPTPCSSSPACPASPRTPTRSAAVTSRCGRSIPRITLRWAVGAAIARASKIEGNLVKLVGASGFEPLTPAV